MSVREVAEEIGIAKSVVRRMKQKIEREAKDEEGQPGGGQRR
jgi:transposase